MKAPRGSINAMHRNGQEGTLDYRDANGFAVFHSDTGTRYTVHVTEVTHQGMTAKERSARLVLWSGWPEGTLRFKIERPAAGEPCFIVARTPIQMVLS